MDDRRANTFSQMNRRKKKDAEVSGQTWLTLVVSAFMGLLFLLSFVYSNDVTSALFLYFCMYMFMLASSLISDFTSVLIDVRDNFIIMPKPVNDRTVVLARLLHILVHVSKLVLPMSLPGIIYMGINIGILASLAFLAMVLLATLLTIFIVNALYIVILRFTSPSKFQNIISWFQIILAIALYAFYQIAPRMLGNRGLGSIDLHVHPVVVLAPPFWFAGAWSVLTGQHAELPYVIMTALAIAMPIISVWIVVKYLAPAFNQKLAGINSASGQEPTATTTISTKRSSKTYSQTLANLFVKNREEKMAFQFTWLLTNRSRDFKLKTYPSIGYLLVMAVVLTINSKNVQSWDQFVHGGQSTATYIMLACYVSSLLLSTALTNIQYSDKHKAAWWYFTAPLQHPGNMISGALKSVLFKFFAPVVLTIIVLTVIVSQPIYYPHIILALCNQVVVAVLFTLTITRTLPFSTVQGNNDKAGSFVRALLTMSITVMLGAIQFVLFKFSWAVFPCIVLSCFAIYFLFSKLQATTWNLIKTKYEG